MAEKEKKHEGGKKAKKHLVSIHTHKASDGGFAHEHTYEDEDGNKSSHFGGVSTDLADLQQHMADHFGPGADDQQQQPAPDDAAAAAPAPGAGGPPQAQ